MVNVHYVQYAKSSDVISEEQNEIFDVIH